MQARNHQAPASEKYQTFFVKVFLSYLFFEDNSDTSKSFTYSFFCGVQAVRRDKVVFREILATNWAVITGR
jgi:hypothetical protein